MIVLEKSKRLQDKKHRIVFVIKIELLNIYIGRRILDKENRMFNVTVLKMKDIRKYMFGMLITIIAIMTLSKYFSKETKEEKIVQKWVSENSMLSCLDQTIPAMSNLNEEYQKIAQEEDEITENKFLQGILKTQISTIKGMENIEEKQKIASEQEQQKEPVPQDTNKVEVAQTNVSTQVITNNPIKENYNTQYGKVKIKNETEYELTNEMLQPDITIQNKNIVLFHTHSCESYTASEAYPYTPTGNFRTTDLNYTVTRVGTELENQLKQYNYNVVHDSSYHDYPAYNGSYTRSLATVEKIIQTTPSDIVLDVHRDAIGSRSDYAPTVKIGENDVAAQIMFVVGTNNGGLWHPNWNQNLKFAIKIQEKAEEMYPGLFKPITLTKSRYNQHTAKYASIIEVGATGNTLEQCLTSMKYLAKVMEEVILH